MAGLAAEVTRGLTRESRADVAADPRVESGAAFARSQTCDSGMGSTRTVTQDSWVVLPRKAIRDLVVDLVREAWRGLAMRVAGKAMRGSTVSMFPGAKRGLLLRRTREATRGSRVRSSFEATRDSMVKQACRSMRDSTVKQAWKALRPVALPRLQTRDLPVSQTHSEMQILAANLVRSPIRSAAATLSLNRASGYALHEIGSRVVIPLSLAVGRIIRVHIVEPTSRSKCSDKAPTPAAPATSQQRWRARVRDLLCIGLLSASSAFAAPAEFAAVIPDHLIIFPQDTGAHPAFRTEWWYATGWLTTPDNQPLGFQITFFRSATGHDANDPSAFAPSQLIIAHAALSDPALGHLAHDQRIARQGFGLAYAQRTHTDVKLDEWKILRAADGHYDVNVDANGFSLHLILTPTQAPLMQGDRGYSRKGPRPEQASYYYSQPQLQVTGNVVRPNAVPNASHGNIAVTGMAWLDHEWSSTLLDANAVGWDWLGANLADGSALMAFAVRSRDGHVIWAHAALRSSAGQVSTFGRDQVDFTPLRRWRSSRTNTLYPVSMSVRTGTLKWRLDPLMDDQELDSRQSTGAVYWEGAVRITRDGMEAGRGYLELTGYADALRPGRQ